MPGFTGRIVSLTTLWKQSVVVPVAKVSRPQTLNDFRPVGLTSLTAKSLEKLIKAELLIKVEPLLDPYQFAGCYHHATESPL